MEKEQIAIDEIVAKRGPNHERVLKIIANTLRDRVLNVDFVNTIFSPESQARIDEFAQERQPFTQILNTLFEAYKTSESSKSPGHEKSHILEATNSAHRIFEEYEESGNPLLEVEKFEAILGCMGHDLGRYVEPALPNLNRKSLEILMPLIDTKKLGKRLQIPEELGNRILYDIGSASPKETGHRVADIVHQCDREQLGGSIMIARMLAAENMEYDFIFPPIDQLAPFATKLPRITEEYPMENLLRLEIWMRNVYPPTSPNGEIARNYVKRQTAVILMLGLLDMDDKYNIVFAPELRLVGDESLEGTKKPLSPKLFKAVRTEFEEFLESVNLDEYSPQKSLELARQLMTSNGNTIPRNFDEGFMQKIIKNGYLVNRNRWLIMKYAFQARHKKRLEDLARLRKPQEGVSATVSQWLIQELEFQEAIFSSSR